MTEPTDFEKFADHVISNDDSELSAVKAERDYALHCLEREIAIAHQAQARIKWLETVVRQRAGEAVMANDRVEVLEAALREIIPARLTGELACILEDCAPPEKQTDEAVAALILGYQPIWDRIVAALTARAALDKDAEK